jgi:hypothetical protein
MILPIIRSVFDDLVVVAVGGAVADVGSPMTQRGDLGPDRAALDSLTFVVVTDTRLVVAEQVLTLFDADLALFSVIPFLMSLRK